MPNGRRKKSKSVSFAIDDRISDALNTLISMKNQTKSEILREAILKYLEHESDGISEETKKYADLLSAGEHVVVDIELWSILLDELNEKASDDFWKLIGNIGYRHGIQHKIKGQVKLQDVLRHIEAWNWFRVKIGEKAITLVLTTHNEQRILKIFLENLFKALDISIEVVDSLRRLVIVEK